MRFKIAETTYSLVFHHSLPMTEAEMLKMDKESIPYNEGDRFGETEAILYEIKNAGTDNEERIERDVAIAYCSPQDTYVKAIGRKKAIEKLINRKTQEWMRDKGYRKLFWKIYFSKTAELPEETYVKYFGCPKITHAYNGITLKPKEE